MDKKRFIYSLKKGFVFYALSTIAAALLWVLLTEQALPN